MKYAFMIFLVLCVCVCITVIISVTMHWSKKYPKYPNYPPPGYKIVCEKEKGWYAPQMPNSKYIIEKDYKGKPFKSYQAAIDRAWYQYNLIPIPDSLKEKYNWVECEPFLLIYKNTVY